LLKFSKKIRRKIFVFLLPVIVFIGILVLFEILVNFYFINVSVVGQNLSFKNFNQAKTILEDVSRQYLNQEFTFYIDKNIVKESILDLGVIINIEQTLNEILNKQKLAQHNFNLFDQITFLLNTKNFDLKVSIDDNKIDDIILKKWARYQIMPQDAYIQKTENDFILKQAQEGRVIDKKKLIQILDEAASKLQNYNFTLKLEKIQPQIKDEYVKEILNQAIRLVHQKNFKLKYKDEIWDVPSQVIFDIISFKKQDDKLFIDAQLPEIENFLKQIAPQIAQKPQNATLYFNEKQGVLGILQKDQSGRELEIKQSAQTFYQAFLQEQELIEISVREIPASLREDNLSELGINTLLGKSSTNFSGSAASRVHNIKIGAAKFNGILLAPQEEFSFNQNLGEVGPQQGYLPGLVIKDNKTVPEYGGGLCQVSTTLFQAAVKAGLKIIERSPHAYPVRFYNPPGFDATIYSPYTDLKFINPTSSFIYIQSEVKGNEIFFYIFGANENKKVILKGPIIYEKNNDGSMKTVLTQEVYDDKNNLLFKKSFYSNYKSPDLYPILRNPLE